MHRLLFSSAATLCSIGTAGLLLAATSGYAFSTEFVRAQGDHSLNSIFGIPTPVPPALQLEQSQLLISGTYANQFAGGVTDNERLLLDGNRSELRLSWYQAIRSCINWGIELPLLAHGDGYFDQFIEGWHELLGLPNGDRHLNAENVLSIEYEDSSGQSLNMTSSSASLGDTHLQLIGQGICGNGGKILSNTVTRVGVKLPTGDIRLLSGSGASDFYIDITTGDLAPSDTLGLRASVGAVILGDTDVLTNQEDWAAFGSSVLGYQYSPSLELLTQLDWHTPLFDSDLRELGSVALQLTIGGRWQLQSGATLDFAFQEDLVPDTAPDITLFFGYRQAY